MNRTDDKNCFVDVLSRKCLDASPFFYFPVYSIFYFISAVSALQLLRLPGLTCFAFIHLRLLDVPVLFTSYIFVDERKFTGTVGWINTDESL